MEGASGRNYASKRSPHVAAVVYCERRSATSDVCGDAREGTLVPSSSAPDHDAGRKALGILYRDLGPTLKRVVWLRAKRLPVYSLSTDDLEEILQEAFCRALRAIETEKYDGRRDLRPYIAGICAHVLSDLVRDRVRKRRREGALRDYELCDGQLTTEQTSHGELLERSELLASWLEQQAPIVRALCHRRFGLGESQRTAAQALELSRQQVRTLELRIRFSFAEYLRRMELETVDEAPSTVKRPARSCKRHVEMNAPVAVGRPAQSR